MICVRPWTTLLAVSLAVIVVACASLSLAAKRQEGTGASAKKSAHASSTKPVKRASSSKKNAPVAKAKQAGSKTTHPKSGSKSSKKHIKAAKKVGTKKKKVTAIAKSGDAVKKTIRLAPKYKKQVKLASKAKSKYSGKSAKRAASLAGKRKSTSSRKRAKTVAVKRRAPPKPLIVLDPGHGGHDPGAMAGGLVEKHVTLSVAKMVRTRLIKKGFRVKLTRSSDRAITPRARVRMASRLKPALFLSLHCNSAPSAGENGIETFAFLEKRRHDGRCSVVPIEEVGAGSCSASQARLLHRDLAMKLRSMGMRENGVRLGRFAVLTPKPWPSILIEMGYLTNKKDARRLASKKYRALFADKLAEALAARFKQKPKVILAGPDSKKKSIPAS